MQSIIKMDIIFIIKYKLKLILYSKLTILYGGKVMMELSSFSEI